MWRERGEGRVLITPYYNLLGGFNESISARSHRTCIILFANVRTAAATALRIISNTGKCILSCVYLVMTNFFIY